MIGKMYEARKKSVGQHDGNQYTRVETGQNVHIPTRRETKDGTAGEIGKEIGVDGRTVQEAAQREEVYKRYTDTNTRKRAQNG